jgi:hypothetical protein
MLRKIYVQRQKNLQKRVDPASFCDIAAPQTNEVLLMRQILVSGARGNRMG